MQIELEMAKAPSATSTPFQYVVAHLEIHRLNIAVLAIL